LRAAARRFEGDRRFAACRACRDRARRDVALWPSRRNAPVTARERRGDGLLRRLLRLAADLALRFVDALAVRGGGGSFTPD
jgi:hypothetical protein